MGALRYRFNTIDTLAVRHNQLSWDNSAVPPRVLDVAGRTGSPYVLHEVAVAAALADSLTGSSYASFRLDPGYLFTNTGAALSSASIDFGDGNAALTLTPGQTVAAAARQSGTRSGKERAWWGERRASIKSFIAVRKVAQKSQLERLLPGDAGSVA